MSPSTSYVGSVYTDFTSTVGDKADGVVCLTGRNYKYKTRKKFAIELIKSQPFFVPRRKSDELDNPRR